MKLRRPTNTTLVIDPNDQRRAVLVEDLGRIGCSAEFDGDDVILSGDDAISTSQRERALALVEKYLAGA